MWTLALTPLLCFVPLKPTEKAGEGDARRIQGVWKIVKMEINGADVALPADEGRFTVTIGADTITTGAPTDNVIDYKLGADQKPPTIDFTPRSGPLKGQTHKGIYELDGDTLRLCNRVNPKEERPAAMSSKDNGMILVLTRVKN
jgi:uncharacterized protein (TIGR03067 family)